MELLGIGSHLPGKPQLSADFDRRFGFAAGHVERMTGVMTRHVCGADDTQITMGATAARRALADAGLKPTDVDLIISAAAVAFQPIPSTAPLYQRALDIPDGSAFGFDINSTCLSFVTALEVCDSLLRTGRYARALIIASEVASRALPWRDRPEIAGLFGDGAAAVVVGPGSNPFHSHFRSYPSAYEACSIGAGGTRYSFTNEPDAFAAHSLFAMDGQELFRVTAKHFVPFVDDVLAGAGWTRDDVDIVVPHQASPPALARMIRQCGFAPEKVVDISRSVGNQVAASIPFGLCHVKERLTRGDKVLLLGTSAGVSFGGAALIF